MEARRPLRVPVCNTQLSRTTSEPNTADYGHSFKCPRLIFFELIFVQVARSSVYLVWQHRTPMLGSRGPDVFRAARHVPSYAGQPVPEDRTPCAHGSYAGQPVPEVHETVFVYPSFLSCNKYVHINYCILHQGTHISIKHILCMHATPCGASRTSVCSRWYT